MEINVSFSKLGGKVTGLISFGALLHHLRNRSIQEALEKEPVMDCEELPSGKYLCYEYIQDIFGNKINPDSIREFGLNLGADLSFGIGIYFAGVSFLFLNHHYKWFEFKWGD